VFAALAEACRALERDDVRITYIDRPTVALRRLAHLFELLFMADISAVLGDTGFREAITRLSHLSDAAPLADVHRRALQLSRREWLALRRDPLKAQRAWGEVFEEVDVVLTPTVITRRSLTTTASRSSFARSMSTASLGGTGRISRTGARRSVSASSPP
jgi:Asp-tRNA(Asn)/Glu-tRNA(Gln) amidotransferase A subunit family amidase